MRHTRQELGGQIATRLREEQARLRSEFAAHPIRHCVIDDLLPPQTAQAIYQAFPRAADMALKKSLRELKLVTAQMDRCEPILEEAIFAFQDARVVTTIAEITGLRAPEPDTQLYAGGISLMQRGHFLNPHIDNSHDRMRERYRVLNLLYYVSPDWRAEHGGSLELWPNGPKGQPITIPSVFNRLVLMETNRRSWHSVNEIRVSAPRCCVSNYYFSLLPPEGDEHYFHVTSFRGRPEQPVRDLLLRADIALRSMLRRIRPMGVVPNKHYYQR